MMIQAKGKTHMLPRFKNTPNAYSSSACVVDGKLILSFPNAQKPVVWQMELGDARSSALEVREKDALHTLILKTPKGDEMEIAPFETHKDALDALMAVTAALQSAHGQIRAHTPADSPGAPYYPASNHNRAPGKGEAKKWIVLAACFVAILFFIGVIKNIQTTGPGTTYDATAANTQSAASSAAQKSGVPVSADEFLLNR